MIEYLFPTAVYKNTDTSFLELANELFDGKFITSDPKFKTTLVNYNPGKASVYWDPLAMPKTAPLVNFIKKSVGEYLKELKYQPYTVNVVNMWLNEMQSGATQKVHTHYGYSLSGCYYCKVPANSGYINFLRHDVDSCAPILTQAAEWFEGNAAERSIQVEEGTIVIFPSNLRHSVPSLKYQGFRRSIAFDINLSM